MFPIAPHLKPDRKMEKGAQLIVEPVKNGQNRRCNAIFRSKSPPKFSKQRQTPCLMVEDALIHRQ
jgi:hypothetical protein